MNALISSPPITSALRTTPVRIIALAVLSAYRKLVQAVLTSIDAARSRRGAACRPEAWLGTRSSTLQLPKTISSTAPGQPRGGQCAHGGDVGKLPERHMGNAPLADAGPARDPLIAGIEEGGEVVIAQYGRWQAFAPTRDRRIRHCWRPRWT